MLSATTEFLEYSITAQPKPTAILVPIRDSITASNINGNLIYVEAVSYTHLTLPTTPYV